MPVLEKIPPSSEAIKHGLNVAIGNIIDPNPPMIADTVPGPTPMDRLGPADDGTRIMTREDIPPCAHSLAEAFYSDPHFRHIIKSDGRRLQRLGHGIATFLEHHWMPEGEVYTHDKLFGVAAWMRPNEWQTSMPSQLRMLPSLIGSISIGDIIRLTTTLDFVESKHQEIERERGPHWYLPMVGVTPAWQGRGFGDALLKPVLERCDKEGTPAYLEASTKLSVPLYERNGFRVIAKGRYRSAKEPLHFMWRDPQLNN